MSGTTNITVISHATPIKQKRRLHSSNLQKINRFWGLNSPKPHRVRTSPSLLACPLTATHIRITRKAFDADVLLQNLMRKTRSIRFNSFGKRSEYQWPKGISVD